MGYQLHAPAALLQEINLPRVHRIRSWVNPKVYLDEVEKRKFLTLLAFELRPSVECPVIVIEKFYIFCRVEIPARHTD
jgi:hypothetical protein